MQDIYDKYYWQNDKVRIRAVHPEDDNYFEKLDSQAWAFASEEMTLPPIKTKIDESKTIEYGKNPVFSIESLNGDYIGDIRFNDINERHGTFEIGISIWRNFRNKGYGKAAMQIILDYAFNERRLNKFKAECIDCNIGSISLWKSLGCKLEGTIREEIFLNGTFHDKLIFGLTANEYKTQFILNGGKVMNKEIQGYKNSSTNDPNWLLLYKLKWAQLADIVDLKNLKILDFGSGFGTTANYLAKDNEVTAIEPNADMLAERECANNYTQIIGKFENLKDFGNDYFDVIICHNVLEFASERCDIVKEFSRILKNDGILSIVKNNSHGRIVSMAVANNIDKAVELIDGGHIANVFGKVVLYNPEELIEWGNNLKIEKILALNTFYGLQQNNDIKHELEWSNKMFNIEMKVADMEPYKSISLFHHVLLRKMK